MTRSDPAMADLEAQVRQLADQVAKLTGRLDDYGQVEAIIRRAEFGRPPAPLLPPRRRRARHLRVVS